MHSTTFSRHSSSAVTACASRPFSASSRLLSRPTAVALAAACCVNWAMAQTADNPPEAAAENAGVVTRTMPEVQVQAERMESRVYDRAEMDATAGGNRDLTSLIANHPAVRTNPAESNGNRGSLAPESFSIHGESPYQNQFLIDGISGTNVINPQEGALGLQVGRVPGYSQAYNIDTDLLDQVQVHDSRIPVEFGHFQGGVVDARIKTPQGSNRFSLKQSFNSSNLTQQQMPESLKEDWNNGEAGNSARWKKHFTSLQGDIRVSEDSAALLSYSRRESRIQRTSRLLDASVPIANGNNVLLTQSDEADRVDNLLGKLHTRWGGGTETNLLLKYADRQENLVSADSLSANMAWTNRQKAMGLGFDISQLLDSGKLTATLGVDQLDALRESDANEYTTQQFADTTLGRYSYGGFGVESLEQRQYSAKLRMDWNTFATGAVQHKLYAGLDLQSADASFVRDQDVYANSYRRLANGSQSILLRTLYKAGTVDVGYNSLGLYLSDTLQWGNWAWTASVRADRDNFLKNTNVSPRTRLDWDAFGNGSTQLSLGWSRYYGADLLGYALAQGKSELVTQLILNNVVTNKPGTISRSNFDDLKTPHSDEWAFNVTQQLTPMLEAGFSYVRRASRDGISKDTLNGTSYYTNGAVGQTETAALSLRTLKPWKAAGADWTGRIDFSWQDQYKNHDSTLGWGAEEEQPDDVIVVDGKTMLRKDKPASGFYQPRRLSLGVTGQWKGAGVTWGNRINWMSSRSGIAFVSSPKGVDTYVSQRLPSYMTWDTSFTYKPAQIKGLTLNVDILNLLNRMPPEALTSKALVNSTRYQTGREIWLTAAYEF